MVNLAMDFFMKELIQERSASMEGSSEHPYTSKCTIVVDNARLLPPCIQDNVVMGSDRRGRSQRSSFTTTTDVPLWASHGACSLASSSRLTPLSPPPPASSSLVHSDGSDSSRSSESSHSSDDNHSCSSRKKRASRWDAMGCNASPLQCSRKHLASTTRLSPSLAGMRQGRPCRWGMNHMVESDDDKAESAEKPPQMHSSAPFIRVNTKILRQQRVAREQQQYRINCTVEREKTSWGQQKGESGLLVYRYNAEQQKPDMVRIFAHQFTMERLIKPQRRSSNPGL